MAKSTLAEVVANIKKQYGDGAVMRVKDGPIAKIETISTGSLNLDLALGVGGLPKGRITEIYGPESSGKTTVCQHLVAEAQKCKGKCAYVDMENALDLSYAARCGVDVSALYISQPDTGEEALGIAEAWIRSGQIAVVVIDSVAALVPKAEIDGDMGDSHMGLQARLMSQAMRKLSGAIKQSNTVVIFTNQLRMKIGVVYGNPEVTSGGNALKFYASVRLDIRSILKIKGDDGITGSHVRVRVTKNKVAPPFREAEFDIMYNEGISKMGEIVDLGTQLEIITKRGAFFSYGEQRIGQGRENSKLYLKEHPDVAAEIEAKIRESTDIKPAVMPDEAMEAEE